MLLLFPDNTVLVNFAIIARVDLLDRLAKGGGRWCASVASECARSAQYVGLEALDDVADILGEPLRPESQAEHLDIRMLQVQLASPGDNPYAHLGEAETLAIITRRALHALFVTDDTNAARLARSENVKTVSTWALLRLAHRSGMVDTDTLWGYLQTLRREDRGHPPGVYDRASFEKWLVEQAV